MKYRIVETTNGFDETYYYPQYLNELPDKWKDVRTKGLQALLFHTLASATAFLDNYSKEQEIIKRTLHPYPATEEK